MEIKLISFGKIAEFLPSQQLKAVGIHDTNQLQKYLESSFPQLAQMKYKIAVNNTLVQENTTINTNDTVAIMPPFSGG